MILRADPTTGVATPLSSEPLINAIHRRLLDFLLAGLTFFLVYACFVPFDFTAPVDRTHDAYWYLGLRLRPINLPDILANISIYVPLGVMAGAVLRRRGMSRIATILILPFCGAALSLAVEYGQHFVRSRVPSWVDVSSNVIGISVGAALTIIFEAWIRRRVAGAIEEARRHWWQAVCRIAVCAVLVVSLRPYDVVVDCYHTAAEAYRHGSVDPTHHWQSLAGPSGETEWNPAVWTRAQWEYALDTTVDVATYAVIAAMVVLGQYRNRRSGAGLLLWSGFVTVSLSAMVTVVRIFLISYGLDTAHFFASLIGWPIGGAAGFMMARRRFRTAAGQATNRPAWGAAAACAMLVVAMYELVPFDIAPNGSSGFSRPCLLPFFAHFNSRPNVALLDISGDLLRYAFFGAGIAVMLWARFGIGGLSAQDPRISTSGNRTSTPTLRWCSQLVIAMFGSAGAAAAFETLHMRMPSRQSDITTVFLALFGSFAGAVAVRWVIDVRRGLAVAFADDLLTHQLIVGETYEPIPTPAGKKQGTTTASSVDNASDDS